MRPLRSLLALLALLGPMSMAGATELPRSDERLPLAEQIRDQLGLSEASTAQLLAGAMTQLTTFFPDGQATPLTGRPQLDALLASTLLLEEGLRRGATSYQQAYALFECYAIMYITGSQGSLEQRFEWLAAESPGPQERALVELYLETVRQFRPTGREGARRLGELLLSVRPDETDVAYTLAAIAESEGEFEAAAELYAAGLEAEGTAARFRALAQLRALGQLDGEERARALAEALSQDDGTLAESTDEQIAQRRRLRELQSATTNNGAPAERYELAVLLREAGQPMTALAEFEALGEWPDAPPERAEEHAIAAMEANRPDRMRAVLAATRGNGHAAGARLLQLRVVAESPVLLEAAAGGDGGLALDEYLSQPVAADLAADLDALRTLEPDAADFARIYLGLILSLIELSRVGALNPSYATQLAAAIAELAQRRPDDRSLRELDLILALYQRDDERLLAALESYETFCVARECQAATRRTALLVLLQVAAGRGNPDLLDDVEARIAAWPAADRGGLYHLVAGTATTVRAQWAVGRDAARLSTRATEQLAQGLTAYNEERYDSGSAADLAALFNNLGQLALERGDLAAARLYLDAARRFRPNHPAILTNLAATLAAGGSLAEAFAVIGLGVSETGDDPAMGFQLLRWAGHLYGLANRPFESADAYRSALALFEGGGDWIDAVDDGLFPGGPVEWGLVYDAELGLTVTLDWVSPPLSFSPAPVSLMEMSAAAP